MRVTSKRRLPLVAFERLRDNSKKIDRSLSCFYLTFLLSKLMMYVVVLSRWEGIPLSLLNAANNINTNIEHT